MIKKVILMTILALSSITIKAQEKQSKLKLHAAAMGFGFFSFQKANYEGGGATFFTDISVGINKNLISASYLGGSEIAILGKSNYGFDEVMLLYGREWKALNWLRFEGFAGLGYYHQKTDYLEYDIDNVPSGATISIPLRVNTKFYFSKKFGMGFNTNYSINSINNTFSTNLIFHYRFN